MPVKDCRTEQLIRDTARRIFLKEGRLLATTQDIADAAGVARPLLHYYFRSRDLLFSQVFVEAFTDLRRSLHEVMASTEPFRQKIERFIDIYFDALLGAPYLETFIILQLNRDPARYEEFFIQLPGGKERVRAFLDEIQVQMEKGAIAGSKPIHFFMNLFALLSYPIIARPIYQNMFGISDPGFGELIGERKEVILGLLFR